jgi:hypothetical protein
MYVKSCPLSGRNKTMSHACKARIFSDATPADASCAAAAADACSDSVLPSDADPVAQGLPQSSVGSGHGLRAVRGARPRLGAGRSLPLRLHKLPHLGRASPQVCWVH